MGYRKLSARPRHHAQVAGVIEDFKKTSPRAWMPSRARRRSTATRSKSGLPMRPVLARRTRSPADGRSAAPAPAHPARGKYPYCVVDAEEARIAPRRHPRRNSRLLRERVAVPQRGAGGDRANGKRDNQGVELEHRDQESIDEPNYRCEEQRPEHGARDGIFVTPREAEKDRARQRDNRRDRQVNATRH